MKIISNKLYESFNKQFKKIITMESDLKEKDKTIRRLKSEKEIKKSRKLAVGDNKKIHFIKMEFETHYLVDVFIYDFGWTTELVEKGDDVIELKEVK